MPGRVKEDDDREERSGEEVNHEAYQVLALGFPPLGHPKHE